MAAGGLLLFRLAEPAYRFLERAPAYWEKEGVIRNGWTKVWRDDNPKRFAFRVGCYRVGATFVWLWLKVVGAVLIFGAGAGLIGYFLR